MLIDVGAEENFPCTFAERTKDVVEIEEIFHDWPEEYDQWFESPAPEKPWATLFSWRNPSIDRSHQLTKQMLKAWAV
jgi:hypothetical protein